MEVLLQSLQPVMDQLHALNDDDAAKFRVTKEWFVRHPENLAGDMSELGLICRLPHEDRVCLAYPIVGNWFIGKLADFEPTSATQNTVRQKISELVAESRFCNGHWKPPYSDREAFNLVEDEIQGVMQVNHAEAYPIHLYLQKVYSDLVMAVNYREIIEPQESLVDIGHGLLAPARHFAFLTGVFGMEVDMKKAGPLDLTVMVVDDQEAEAWYKRLITVGFKHTEGQTGYFSDCESALAALEIGRYDVILSDLELGEGKMSGIEFVEIAHQIQRMKGIRPMISVFSDSQRRLEEADFLIGPFSGSHPPYRSSRLFHQVNNSNNKASFTASGFRFSVLCSIPRAEH